MNKAWKSWDGLQARPPMPVSEVVSAQKNFLKEINNATLVNIWMLRKQNRRIVDMEKVLVVCLEDQTNHNILFSQSLIQSKALTLQFYEGCER